MTPPKKPIGGMWRGIPQAVEEDVPTRGPAAESGRRKPLSWQAAPTPLSWRADQQETDQTPGYNLTGMQQHPGQNWPKQKPPTRFQGEGGFIGLAEKMGGFRQGTFLTGGADATTAAEARRFARGGPNIYGRKPGEYSMTQALAAASPEAAAAYTGTKWAFRGNRTAHTYSLARQQNVYGGVQRTAIPTRDISVSRREPTASDVQRAQTMHRINMEQEYPGAGFDQPATGNYTLPVYRDAAAAPTARYGRPSEENIDPLFQKNTGQGIGVNPYGFSAHQRATTGF